MTARKVGEHVEVDQEEARAGQTGNHVRYILAIGTVLPVHEAIDLDAPESALGIFFAFQYNTLGTLLVILLGWLPCSSHRSEIVTLSPGCRRPMATFWSGVKRRRDGLRLSSHGTPRGVAF